MKRITQLGFLAVFFLFSQNKGISQAYYNNNSKKDKKYYAAIAYGVGSARWYSDFINAPLYNIDGSILKYGDLRMLATNPMYYYDFSVSAQMLGVRVGAGIRFEKFSMDKLSIISADSSGNSAPNSYILFTENFWFNEIYATLQVPFKYFTGKPYSVEATMNLGFYGYDGIRHLNFFGDDQLASTYHCSIGALADYEIMDNVRIFIHPELEYKYFHNNPNEAPAIIIHNIFTAMFSVGIRCDMGKL
jgi:hypothetical protein